VYWGLSDVTDKATNQYADGNTNFPASNTFWGVDGWPNIVKSLVVVYDLCGVYTTAVAREGGSIDLPE